MDEHAAALSASRYADNDREVARFVRRAPRPRLVRVLGAPGSGRTRLALDLVSAEPALSGRNLVFIDTLGHGLPELPPSLDVGETLHVPATDLEVAFASARRLLATGQVAAIVIDDLLGLDARAGASEGERLQRFRMIQRALQILASACLERAVLLIVLDRISPMGVVRTPIGFTDVLAGSGAPGLAA